MSEIEETGRKEGMAIVKFDKTNISIEEAKFRFERLVQDMKSGEFELILKSFTSLTTKHWFICGVFYTDPDVPHRPGTKRVVAKMAETLQDCDYNIEEGAVLIKSISKAAE